jgi:putative transcriptional regulator
MRPGGFKAGPIENAQSGGEGNDVMKDEMFNELMQSLREASQIKRGEMKPSRAFKVNPKNDIAKVRHELGLSQSQLATILGISLDTLQNWEQGRRKPTGPAKVLLRIILKHPRLLLDAA